GSSAVANTIIATDGAGSAVRNAMLHGCNGHFELSQKLLEHGYKELHIPAGDAGSFLLEKNALHIWPRHKFMMIALPNFDGSFTCTLFLANIGASQSFEQLNDEVSLREFFEREFPDAVPLMP